MKTARIWTRAPLLLVAPLIVAGCWNSAQVGTSENDARTNVGVDAGIDTGIGIGADAGADTGADARADGGADADAGTDVSQPPRPIIAVSEGAIAVASGSLVTVNGAVAGTSASTAFTIGNTGTADLTISGVTVDGAAFSLTQTPMSTVAAGGSTSFTITFSPTDVGTKTGTVTIANNASSGFSFPISAQATAVPLPAISVSVGDTAVASGGTLAFGSVEVGAVSSKTVTIRNGGTAALILSANPVVTGGAFSLTTAPASLTVAPGTTTTFVVTFTPTASGGQTGGVSIANNTTDASPYTIALTGTGTITATGFTVTGANGATSITSIGGTLQLAAAVVPSGAPNPGVTWSSGTPGVATVDATGLVTSVANGTTIITATAADGSGLTGTLSVIVANPFVYFVKQALGTTTATLAGGAFTVNSNYGNSGNAFKFVTPNYYGTTSNGFLAFPTMMTGDFSITANITITTQNKGNTACGIGVGITTGFSGTDLYAYSLMRNSTALVSGVVNGYYVNALGSTSAGAPTVNFTNNTALTLTFSRTGTNLTYGAGLVGGALTTNTAATSFFTNGTNVYGAGPVYPAISFNNVAATITNLVIKDGTGATVYDSATGDLVNYIPASLTLSAATASMTKGNSATVTATANAVGGAVSTVTAVSADPTIATATVVNGATNSTITLTGQKGGNTTVTVTNTGDASAATNSKTIVVAVTEYATTDGYGSIAARVYPAPGETSAYNDGELALTFDAPPTLNPGGTIKIYKLADGSEADSIGFSGETLTYGTTAINVGSQLVRLSGNTAYFTPHVGKLAYATGYYVVIPTTSITGTLNTVAFNGLSNLSTVATWSFTTRAAPTLSAGNVTVDGAQTSTANFRTLGGALGALATGLPGATNVTINVAAGTYNELVRYTGPSPAPATPQTVNIVGPAGNNQGDNCIIQYANGNAINGSTQTRASVYLTGANFVLQNITLRNTAVRSVLAQAEALYFAGGAAFTLAAFNSSFYSNQDTIQTSGRNWFYSCHIEGNVDFIWGTADAALFENCSLRFVNDIAAGGPASYSLFVARTGTTIAATASGSVGKGYVLLNSTVSVDANVTATFGRDAGQGAYYDQVALINVVFSGAGTIGPGLWNITTAPLSLGDASYVGWKSAGCTGLNLPIATAAGTSTTITGQATEYDTRDHILNRTVTVMAGGVPSGYQPASTLWDVSSLATLWGAPQAPVDAGASD